MSVLPTVTVRGRFVTSSGPLSGPVTFTPSRFVVDPNEEEWMAVVARSVELIEGTFSIQLSANVKYDVEVPHLGRFKIKPPRSRGPLLLSDLMPKSTKRK